MSRGATMPKPFIAVQYLKERDYWREKFAEPITKSGFPYDENVSGGYSKDRVKFAFSEEVSAKLIKMSGGSMQRLQMILVAGVASLLYKYTGNEDILIGSPIYAQEASCEFINTVLALRNKIVGSYSFKDCILQVKQTVIEAIENQNYPIEKIFELIGGDYDKQGLPLLDTVVMLENIQDRKHSKNVRANLLFAFVKVEGELKCTAEYNSMHFQRRIVERILIHLNNLFLAIVRDINVRIGDIDILTVEEKQRMIFEFNTSMKDMEVGLLHELFEKQAKKTPEKIAVIAGNEKMTYRELNQKANQVAKMLRNNGVMPNDIVGIMVENPGAMAVGLLGILKSGGAYLPIDPEYPAERIQYLLEDSGIKMLLIYDEIKEGISFNGKTININDEDIYRGEMQNLDGVNKPEDLAYIIYTSGTTGKPKGVMIEHKSISETIRWRSEEYRLNQNDTAMQLFSYAFDGFVTSFFTPLVSGTKLIMLSNNEHKDLNVIKKCICENKVTHFICVPSLYMAIMEYLTPVEAESLRIVTLAGEKLTANVVKWSKRINPDLELVNEYGPTENSVVSTICRDINVEGITIGRPVVNTRVYIMDSDGNMVPEGVAGELCLSGNRLARGYLNRPELNHEKFIVSCFEKGERIYKTGDIARWLPDGNIEYLGRKDSQVKVRGFRIELREIETKLLVHEHIKDAAVIDQKDMGGDCYLCAYIVSEEELTATNLREYLLGKLPDYMVPSFFVKLDKIPLTYNGKIDRKALSQLGKMKLSTLYVAPRNAIEEKLVEVWREVLGVERIGIDDNFFDLGGNSLKAIQAVAQLSLEFEIKINDVFVYKNIRNLAAGISFKSSNLKNTIEELKKMLTAPVEKEDDIKSELQAYADSYGKYKDLDLSERYNYKNILLVGATGYLGAYLLKELLENTNYHIHLLIRGRDNSETEKRIVKKLVFYFNEGLYDTYKHRICVHTGDLTKQNMGLSKERYTELSNTIDCIINSAAIVKHYGDYREFHELNVGGTEQLLKFAEENKAKHYNHISTVSIAQGNSNICNLLFTEFDQSPEAVDSNYYIKTKILAEDLILQARNRGIIGNIYRVGNVVFDSATGCFQENIDENGFYGLIKSLINVKTVPELTEPVYDFSFVNQVAQTVSLLFDKKKLAQETYHIFNPYRSSMADIGKILVKLGFNVQLKQGGEFLDFLYENYCSRTSIQEHVQNIFLHTNILEGIPKNQHIIVNDKTNLILSKLGFNWLEVNETHFRKMMNYCKEIGFIDD